MRASFSYQVDLAKTAVALYMLMSLTHVTYCRTGLVDTRSTISLADTVGDSIYLCSYLLKKPGPTELHFLSTAPDEDRVIIVFRIGHNRKKDVITFIEREERPYKGDIRPNEQGVVLAGSHNLQCYTSETYPRAVKTDMEVLKHLHDNFLGLGNTEKLAILEKMYIER